MNNSEGYRLSADFVLYVCVSVSSQRKVYPLPPPSDAPLSSQIPGSSTRTSQPHTPKGGSPFPLRERRVNARGWLPWIWQDYEPAPAPSWANVWDVDPTWSGRWPHGSSPKSINGVTAQLDPGHKSLWLDLASQADVLSADHFSLAPFYLARYDNLHGRGARRGTRASRVRYAAARTRTRSFMRLTTAAEKVRTARRRTGWHVVLVWKVKTGRVVKQIRQVASWIQETPTPKPVKIYRLPFQERYVTNLLAKQQHSTWIKLILMRIFPLII